MNPDLGPVELRRVSLSSVDSDGRTVELIAVPYDRWAAVEHQGRIIEESVAPGAFGKVDQRIERRHSNVYLEHDRTNPDNWVGRIIRLDPDDPKGLRAVLRIRKGNQQVLDDIGDDMYSASIGMAVPAKGQEWSEDRNRRRVVSAFLDHIALTATPAYSGTDVIAIRHAAASSTPNLDRILAERAAAGLQSR